MKCPLFLVFFLSVALSQAQLQFSQQDIELGTIREAYEIKGDVVVANTSEKKIFLMRADADRGVKIYVSRKALLPGDTCLMVISFIPENKGAFSKNISLITSDREKPYRLRLSGNLQSVKTDDKLACFYFGERRISPVQPREQAIVIPEENKSRRADNRIPDQPGEPVIGMPTENPHTPREPEPLSKTSEEPDVLPETEYKPNNILFLVDVSGSMKDSLKLPLMKNSLHLLVDAIRDVDRITFVTYADTIKVLKEASGADAKKELHATIDALKAKGMTKGRKAILFSQQVAQKHFIEDGNNQIFLATDGKFRFEKEDRKLWEQRQGDKPIIISAIAYGNEREAVRNLKDIARKGKGSFIQVNRREGSETVIIEEIKKQSRR